MTVPSLDMTWETSLTSSSSIIFQILAECSSPSDSMMIGGAFGAGEGADIFLDGGF